MQILIDYENVRAQGLEGVENLESKDSIYFFFSAAAPKIKTGLWEMIKKSNCNVSGYYLKNPSKNAIDFSIAVHVGDIISNEDEEIAIISNDSDYKAIRDYCEEKYGDKIVLANTIKKAFMESRDCVERRLRITQEEEMLLLDEQIERYNKDHDLYEKCRQFFANTDMQDRVDEIVDLLLDKPTNSKVLYVNTLKKFGKDTGLATYHEIKRMLA